MHLLRRFPPLLLTAHLILVSPTEKLLSVLIDAIRSDASGPNVHLL